MLNPRQLALALAVLTLPLFGSMRAPQVAPDVVNRGKLATALVDVGNGKINGSAFCIARTGLFVTNAHVVETVSKSEPCVLVIHPGEKDQRKSPAHIVRIDKLADLAILQIEGKTDTPALELSDSDSLIETQELVVFGFPFGTDLAAGAGEFPGVTVTTGRVTALRKTDGLLVGVQMDAAIHPGNSGGPVLNAKGQVIGITVARFTKAQGINLAIPVNMLHGLLRKTEVVFNPPVIPPSRSHDRHDFVIQISTFAPPPAPYQVEFSLKTGDGPYRVYPAQSADDHTFHVTAVPVPVAGTAPAPPLRLTVQDGPNEVVAHVSDRVFRVGGKEVHLNQVQEIRLMPNPAVMIAGGTSVEGEITGLGDAEAEVAGSRIPVHLSRATRIVVDDVAGVVPTVAYHIIVRRQRQIVAESSGALSIASNAVVAAPPAAANLQGSSIVRFEEAHVYPVPAAGDGLQAADLDGDRIPDVLVGGGSEIGILYGRRDGTLEPYQPLLKWQAAIGHRELVDMNADGRLDLVFVDAQGKFVILYNKGARKFSDPVFQPIESLGALFVGDLNRDGRPDIAVAIPGDGGAGTLRVFLNVGDGTFHKQFEVRHIGILEGVTAKDINGDGIPDLAVSYETSTVNRSGVSIYYGDGKGNFRDGPGYDIGTMNMVSPTFADLNGDGKPDLLLCNYWGGNVAVFLNKGDGTFDVPSRHAVHAYPIRIGVGDFNRDGKLDFVVSSAGTSTVSVFRSRGNGQFDDAVPLEAGGSDCRGVVVADLNRDGRPDLITQNAHSSTISVLINRTGDK